MKRFLALTSILAPLASAQTASSNAAASAATTTIDPNLVGTWTTSSRKVFTGPGFYDPANDKLFEPDLPGISYSFTSDGHYEEAYYRAVANPSDPSCPSAIMQWQHGTFVQLANNSLSLTPFGVDGRQLMSEPCEYDTGVYTRYTQSEFFKSYEVVEADPFHGIKRLNLYQFDGSPMNPMYIAYSPTPQMLPTVTLNPTSAGASATGSAKSKRSMPDSPFGGPAKPQSALMNPDTWWWFGVIATGLGGVAYFAF